MRNTTGRIVGGALLGTLAVGAFALGAHLGPHHSVGHDLYVASSAVPSSHGPLLLASTHQVAQGTSRPRSDAGTGAEDFAADGPAATFQEVYQLMKRNYVEGVPSDTLLAHGAASSMLASLHDPASRFLEPAQVAEMKAEAQGTFHGLGAVTYVRTITHPRPPDLLARDPNNPDNVSYRLVVVTPLPGSPAEKAGLKTGDVITDVNGKPAALYDRVMQQIKDAKAAQQKNDAAAQKRILDELTKEFEGSSTIEQAEYKLIMQAEDTLTDPSQKTMTLTVTRPGQPKPLTLTADTSQPTVVAPVSGKLLPGGVGYIQVVQFADGADKTFASTLSGFGADLKGLIVDLRSSPGGLLDVGQAIAAQVTTAPTLGILQTRNKHESPLTVAGSKTITCPVTVLVNGGTANTAELLAAAVQSGGGKVVGTSTFGDAMDVKPIALRDGSGFTMTVGQLFTPAHVAFAGVGIKPDVLVPDTGDAPLNRAVDMLAGRVARLPGR